MKTLIIHSLALSLLLPLAAKAQQTVVKPEDKAAVAAKALDTFVTQLDTSPSFLMEMLADDRDRVERLLRAAQKDRPTARAWPLDIRTLFAADVFAGKKLEGKEKVAHFKRAVDYLSESLDITLNVLSENPNRKLEALWPGLALDLSLAALEAGELDFAKLHATKTLRYNKDRESWDYGNIIHKANQILGRVALREGKLAAAKAYLLKAGATPGSPQLNTHGPQFLLAEELMAKGEKETVLKYLDLVAAFWANPDERTSANSKRVARLHSDLLEAWKKQVSAGKIPDHVKWR
ncbi:MAG: hypothetical protein ACPGVU_14655 [Limisphaerales bacterium]